MGPRVELDPHLKGIEAIMESRFRYGERQLSAVLGALVLDADLRDVLGLLRRCVNGATHATQM